jgi:hypothetical protein
MNEKQRIAKTAVLTMGTLTISTVLTVGLLTWGYAMGEAWSWVPLIIAVGALWLAGQRYRWHWMTSWALVFCVSFAAAGMWAALNEGLMLGGVLAALSAWDLDHFAQQLRSVEQDERTPLLERRHIVRLLLVDVVGLLVTGAAFRIDLEFGLGIAFLLGLLAIVGLSRTISFLRRESD